MTGFPNLAQLMGDDIVTVYVGPREKRYSVHKALLTSQSEYFEKALNGKFKEADEQTIRLPEDSPDAFDLLIGWLYQNQIPVLGYGPGPFDEFPRGLVVGATKLGTAVRPPNRGTGSVAYQPHEEISASPSLFAQPPGNNNLRDRFNHISTQPEYNQYSSDELRLEDYALNHRFSDFSRPSPENVVIPDPFPVSPGRIDGIPYCSPIEPIMESEEAHQLALIRLCLFAETICWTSLFNIAMSTYMQGERFLAPRPMPTEHIELIYERAHPESPCRKFAADATISQINAAGQIDRNMDLVEQWPSFLEDIFKRLRLTLDLSHTHGPNARGPCEYHVHNTKHHPEKCSAASESRKFILDARVPAKPRFVANPKSHFRGVVDSENTGSGNDGIATGSSGEIRYTTYLPNTGYTTRTLGYDDTTGAPPYDTFGRSTDSMDLGSGYRPWLNGGGFGQTPTPGFGTGGFGGFGSSSGFGTGPPFGGAAAPTTTNPTTTAASSSPQTGGLGSTGTGSLPPQAVATAPLPASSSLPQVPISVSITSENGRASVAKLNQTEPTISATPPNTSASITSPAIVTSVSGSSEAGASNATPQKGTGDVTGSSQGSNPTFGKVSPLASPLPPRTAKSTSADGIFGQRLASSSSTTSPGSFFPSPEPAAHTNIPTGSGSMGSTPLPSFSTSGTDARATPPSTTTASTSPFGLLGARSTPAPSSFSLSTSTLGASDASAPAKSSSNLFGSKSESNALPWNVASTVKPANVGGLFGSTSRASNASISPNAGGLFGSTSRASDASIPAKPAPSNLFGPWNKPNVSPSNATSTTTPSNVGGLFGSTSRASDASMPAKPASSNLFGPWNKPNVSPSNATSTTTPSNVGGLFGSTSRASDASMPAKPTSSNLFGLRNESNVSPSNATSTITPSNVGGRFGSTSRPSDANLPKENAGI
ncbi:hypothetical protein V500_02917 [Pseudogymnoascus sp. VKM F-4518 (FW-2643)]|nr:hypothetical protein V500_02917 [Pseudogymnoascus sp. VKM F-4518 (FW-2643)]